MLLSNSIYLLQEASWEVPVVLVGNKKDQTGDRMVSSEEGIKRSRDIGCHAFHEISVRESIDEVRDKVTVVIYRHHSHTV